MIAAYRIAFAVAGLLAVAMAGPAAAHPHVFVDARAEIVFDKAGAMTAVRHIWQFDAAFTAFAIQGLDANNDGKLSDAELKPLAKVNVDSLKDYDFFTWLRQGKKTYPFVPPTQYWLEFHGGRLTLFYTLPLKTPVVIHGKATLEVFDPEYFVAFTFPEHKPVTLTNAPAGCTAQYHPPHMLDAKTMAKLAAIPADQHDLPPELQDAAAGLANLIALQMPGRAQRFRRRPVRGGDGRGGRQTGCRGRAVGAGNVARSARRGHPDGQRHCRGASRWCAATGGCGILAVHGIAGGSAGQPDAGDPRERCGQCAAGACRPGHAGDRRVGHDRGDRDRARRSVRRRHRGGGIPAAAQSETVAMRSARARLAPLAAALAVLVVAAGAAHAASPFGIATPDSTSSGFGGPLGPFFVEIAYYQGIFYKGLTQALTDIKANGWAVWLLLTLSFVYGVFHAAGPGHGKAVISAYMVSSGETVRRGIALSFLAAFVQAVSAVVIVGVAAVIFRVTAVTMTKATDWFEILSYALVALVGGWLLWSKTVGGGHHHHHHHHHVATPDDHDHHDHHDHDHDHDHHDHAHAHAGATVAGPAGSFVEMLSQAWSAILAVGVRPCSGAIIVLVFALSQGLFLAGVAATFVMALGTGLTVASIAVLAVSARGVAVRLAGVDSPVTGRIVRVAEILAAAAVLCLGLVLLGGSLVNGLP